MREAGVKGKLSAATLCRHVGDGSRVPCREAGGGGQPARSLVRRRAFGWSGRMLSRPWGENVRVCWGGQDGVSLR